MKYIFYSFFVLFLVSCKTTKDLVPDDEIFEVTIEETLLDTLTVTAPMMGKEEEYAIARYNPSYTRIHDLLHTSLDIKFDWQNQYVIGKAKLDFSPIREADVLELDAKGFDINSINSGGRALSYDYDTKKLIIDLPKMYKRGEKYTIEIDYVAKPNEGEEGGSAAITSDKGLFFINPLGDIEGKPQQIWTQGETENNSRWFPTIDKPNERTSQEIRLTVQDKFVSLSNGLLISSTKNSDGTRTDYWKQDRPHAPYLFFVGVGDYAVVKDKWNGKDLMYYVEHDYKDYAKEIFNHTPEMLSFFSDMLDYPYPWDKYAQFIGRDYVSGAMENTGAVIFGEFVQKTDRELIDNDNDFIVAHEMFHHWFGDLVTCESWANLTMNEGFANYSEYLWYEHKYGRQRADYHRVTELGAYLQSAAQQGIHPLIHYEYEQKEAMFDAHSYNKGGLVLHMLRNYLGDDIFFLGLNKYLRDNEYTAVEADDLRLAMEDVSGEDLNWFFNQWFFESGHPELDIIYSYDAANQEMKITVEQQQDTEQSPAIFQLALTTKVYNTNGDIIEYPIWINQRKQEIILTDVKEKPAVVVLDGDNILLGTQKENKTIDEWVAQFRLSDLIADKTTALRALKGKPEFKQIVDVAIKEEHQLFRKTVVGLITDEVKLENLAKNDPHSSVRSEALKTLYSKNNTKGALVAKQILNKDKAYGPVSKALEILSKSDPTMALKEIDMIASENPKPLFGTIADIYAKSGELRYLDFFEKNLHEVSIYSVFNFYNKYYNLAKTADADKIVSTAKVIKTGALGTANPFYKRFVSTNTIHKLSEELSSRMDKEEDKGEKSKLEESISTLQEMINDIKSKEQDADLLQRYSSF